MLLTIVITVAASLCSALGVHFLTRHHIARSLDNKTLALMCSFCGANVVRYEQLPDSKIRCANCKRGQEK